MTKLLAGGTSSVLQKFGQVILDNHVSDADWCCSDTDRNGLAWNGSDRIGTGSPLYYI